MEKKLVKLNLRQLKNAEAGELVKRLLSDLGTLPPFVEPDATYQKFLTLLNERHLRYESCLHSVLANEATKKIVANDFDRDQSMRVLRKMAGALKLSINAAESEHARVLCLLLNEYKGIESTPYEAETQSLDKLIIDLESSSYAPIVSALKLTPYVAQIKTSNEAFKQLFGSRITIEALKEVKNASEFRIQMLAVYTQLTQYLLAMANISNMGYYDQLLSLTNGGRKYFADMLARRNGSKEAAAEKAQASAQAN